MRTTIRQATFETNSSSVHAFVYLSSEAYDYWMNSNAVLLLDQAWEDSYQKLGSDDAGSDEEHAIDASRYIVGREVYDERHMSLAGQRDFTYKQACELNDPDSEYECDSFHEESLWEGGWMLEFDYFD